MPLLNYTTTVPVNRSVAQLQGLLIEAGARSIATEYSTAGSATAIAFTSDTPLGPRAFVLPVNAKRVQAVLQRERLAPRYTTFEQAERVAWRILKDWAEAQLAIIRTEMVTLDQVMLPYMKAADGRSVYEMYRDDQLALPAP
jgi:hypothetical protein